MAGLSNLFGGDVGGPDDDATKPGPSGIAGDGEDGASGDENNGGEHSGAEHEGVPGGEHDLSLGAGSHDLGDAAHSLGLDDSFA